MAGLRDAERAGGPADLEVVARWLDDGIAPNGACGRAFGRRDNHGFDLTFAAPKSVSLLRALGDDVTQKAVRRRTPRAIGEALEYLHRHAGYTRVHNPATGTKDLVRLPGVITAAYQHETSRARGIRTCTPTSSCPINSPAATAGWCGRSKSLHHEAKAAGSIYQATLRRELHQALGIEWAPVDPHTGMAEIAGVRPDIVRTWSRRSTQLRAWAAHNLVLDNTGAGPSAAQLATAQKATRPAKPEQLAWPQLRRRWADVSADSAWMRRPKRPPAATG